MLSFIKYKIEKSIFKEREGGRKGIKDEILRSEY